MLHKPAKSESKLNWINVIFAIAVLGVGGDNALSDTRGNIHSIFQKQAWQLVECEIPLGKKNMPVAQ
jgi:hypothetical protein